MHRDSTNSIRQHGRDDIGKRAGSSSIYRHHLSPITILIYHHHQRFYLSDNSFSSTIPTQLGRLTKMFAKFVLSSNMFTGDVPTEVGRLRRCLPSLLSSNMFSGDIPIRRTPPSFRAPLTPRSPSQVQALSSGVTDSWQVKTGNSIGTYLPTPVSAAC